MELSSIKFQFTQDGNTLGTTDSVEILDVCLEYQIDTKSGPFIVLKSNTGWSIDDKEELIKILNYCSASHDSFLMQFHQKPISTLDY